MKLKDQVEAVLKQNPESRNSDITLTILIWERYYPQFVLVSKATGAKGISLDSLYHLPSQDGIKRYRASFQNSTKNPKYLPTSLEVVRQRRIKEEIWRAEMARLPLIN